MPVQTHRLAPAILAALLVLPGAAHADDEFTYTVQAGDHPWNIAQRYLKDSAIALQLSRWNRIANDRRIAPGTVLRIPAQWLKLESTEVRVLSASGQATIVTGGDTARPVRNGEALHGGAVVRTGAQSSAMLAFDDGSRVLVRQASELRLVQSDRRALDGGFIVQLELVRGALQNAVTPRTQGPRTRFEIRTPAAVAAVRGTEFRLHTDAGTTWTEVLHGSVELASTSGAVQAQAGFGSLARTAEAPEPTRPLLPAPTLNDLPQRIERLPIDWPLGPVAGAVAYRTELAPDTRFDTVLSDEINTLARTRVLDIADGNYLLRVRAIDSEGLEGLAAERQVVVHARPQAPALVSPIPDARTTETQPVFRWTAPDPGWNYQLEVRKADAPDTAALQARATRTANGTTLASALVPGEYLWRVASVMPATGRQGPWGDAQRFSVLPVAPEQVAVQHEPEQVTVRWPAVPFASGYDVQLTQDGTFLQPLASHHAGAAQQQFGALAPGSYQLRLRSVRQDGVAGPWGPVQDLEVPAPPPPEPKPQPDWKPLLILLPALILLGL